MQESDSDTIPFDLRESAEEILPERENRPPHSLFIVIDVAEDVRRGPVGENRHDFRGADVAAVNDSRDVKFGESVGGRAGEESLAVSVTDDANSHGRIRGEYLTMRPGWEFARLLAPYSSLCHQSSNDSGQYRDGKIMAKCGGFGPTISGTCIRFRQRSGLGRCFR